MTRRLGVATLEDIAGLRLRRYLTDHCWTVAKIYRGIEIEQIINREELLPLHIEQLRNRIFESIPWYLDDKVVAEIIHGVYDAVEEKQKQYQVNTKIPVYKTELFCMTTMIDLIVTPRLRNLDMNKLPKILRTHVTSRLHKFTGLKYLNLLLLGFGVDSRKCGETEVVAPTNIISALRSMSLLTHLVLPNFATNNIIKALSVTCRETLTRLDIDHSSRVSDAATSDLAQLDHLVLLSMAGTSLSNESLARLLLALTKLLFLPNGDFLCDCLEWLAYDSSEEFWPKASGLPRFSIQEFTSSEDYHFHSKKQMELVSVMCPYISKMRFFYDSEILCEIGTLEKFHHLQELCLNGGDFNKDPLRQMIENLGHNWTKLELNHVDNIDRHAVVQLSLCCSQLQSLTFSACSFLDHGALHRELFEYYQAGGLDTTEELELALLLRDQEVLTSELEGLLSPFQSLKELKISCGCSKSTIVFLLLHCPGLTKLFLGSSTELSNETITEVLSHNSLTSLEELEISSGEDLDRQTIDIFLSACSNLRKIKGIQYWKGISQAEKERLKNFIRINNLDLDITGLVTQDMSPFTYKVELSEEQKRFLSTA